MLTILFGLGTSVGYALHDFLMVKVVRAVSVWTALTWSMGTALVILLPLALILDGLPAGGAEWRAAGFGVLSGLAEAAGLAALLRGLVVGRLSLVTPLASLSGGFAALVMILRGEAVTPLLAAGLALAVIGGMLASIERVPKEEVFGAGTAEAGAESGGAGGRTDAEIAQRDAGAAAAVKARPAARPARRTRATAGAGWALFSAVLFSVAMLLLAEAGAIEPVSLAAFGRIGTVAVMLPVALLLRRLLLPRYLVRRTVTAGCFDAAAFVCMAAAVTLGPVAVASVMSAQGGLAAAVLGFIFLHERLARVQYAGVALTCVAVALLAAG